MAVSGGQRAGCAALDALDHVRCKLSRCPFVNVAEAFAWFDLDRRERLNLSEVEIGLQNLHIVDVDVLSLFALCNDVQMRTDTGDLKISESQFIHLLEWDNQLSSDGRGLLLSGRSYQEVSNAAKSNQKQIIQNVRQWQQQMQMVASQQPCSESNKGTSRHSSTHSKADKVSSASASSPRAGGGKQDAGKRSGGGRASASVAKAGSRHSSTHSKAHKVLSASASSPGDSGGAGGGGRRSGGGERGWGGGLADRLPTEKTAEQREKRMAMFEQFDPNGNGYLSLAEVDKGLHETYGLEGVYNCKPAIMRAFSAAKGLKQGGSGHDDDYVTKVEFRMLLVYLKQYFELFEIFDGIDTGNDRRIDAEEFGRAVSKLREWGMEIADDPKRTFAEIDGNGGGQILFEEFCEWAMDKNLLGHMHEDEAPVVPHRKSAPAAHTSIRGSFCSTWSSDNVPFSVSDLKKRLREIGASDVQIRACLDKTDLQDLLAKVSTAVARRLASTRATSAMPKHSSRALAGDMPTAAAQETSTLLRPTTSTAMKADKHIKVAASKVTCKPHAAPKVVPGAPAKNGSLPSSKSTEGDINFKTEKEKKESLIDARGSKFRPGGEKPSMTSSLPLPKSSSFAKLGAGKPFLSPSIPLPKSSSDQPVNGNDGGKHKSKTQAGIPTGTESLLKKLSDFNRAEDLAPLKACEAKLAAKDVEMEILQAKIADLTQSLAAARQDHAPFGKLVASLRQKLASLKDNHDTAEAKLQEELAKVKEDLSSATKQLVEATRERDAASKERDASKKQEAQAKKDLLEQMEIQANITIVENVVMREQVAKKQGKCSQCLRIICACKPAAKGNPDESKSGRNPHATNRSELLQAQKERDDANAKGCVINIELRDLRRVVEDLNKRETNHQLRKRDMKDNLQMVCEHVQSICTEIAAEKEALVSMFAETHTQLAEIVDRTNAKDARMYCSGLNAAGAPPSKRARSADGWRHSVNSKNAARSQKALIDEERKKSHQQQQQIAALEADVLLAGLQKDAAKATILSLCTERNGAQALVQELQQFVQELQQQQHVMIKEQNEVLQRHEKLQQELEKLEGAQSHVSLQLAQVRSEADMSAAAAVKSRAAEAEASAHAAVLEMSLNDQRRAISVCTLFCRRMCVLRY